MNNFVKTTLAVGISSTAVTIELAAAPSPYFNPAPDGGVLTLCDNLANPTQLEIVEYVAFDGTNLTGVTRGAEGSTASAWESGSFMIGSITAGMYKKSVGQPGDLVFLQTGVLPPSMFWLDGSTLSQAVYPELAAYYGVASGDFDLPDIHGLEVVLSTAGSTTSFLEPDGSYSQFSVTVHEHSPDFVASDNGYSEYEEDSDIYDYVNLKVAVRYE